MTCPRYGACLEISVVIASFVLGFLFGVAALMAIALHFAKEKPKKAEPRFTVIGLDTNAT